MAQIITFLKIIQDGILPHHKAEPISTTNLIFRLHTKYTSTALLVSASLLYIQQLFVDHLKCIRPQELGTAVESTPLNQLCYTQGTYSKRNESDPFFSPHSAGNLWSVTHYHHYFQWVPFVLLVQGMILHVTQVFWNKWIERGRLASFCAVASTDKGDVGKPEEMVSAALTENPITQDVRRHKPFAPTIQSTSNKKYYYGFICCEILNSIVVLIVIITTEWFTGGRFILMGPKWASYLHKLRTASSSLEVEDDGSDKTSPQTYIQDVETGNPLESAFPSLFTCNWQKPMDPSKFYALPCVLAQNVTHQRLFLLLWLAYILLLVFGISNLFYRLRIHLSPKLREELIERHMIKRGVLPRPECNDVVVHISAADWFLLKRILNNVGGEKFNEILCEISKERLKSGRPSNSGNGNRVASKPVAGENQGPITTVELIPMTSTSTADGGTAT